MPIRRTKRVIVPLDFNEEADLEQAGDAAMREFMLMQQIKLFSPKCHRYEGPLKVREFTKSKCAKAFSCFSKNSYLPMHCVIDNKLLKMYTDSTREVLEAILDFDLLSCEVSVNERTLSFTINIESSNEIFSFKTDSLDTLDVWVKEI